MKPKKPSPPGAYEVYPAHGYATEEPTTALRLVRYVDKSNGQTFIRMDQLWKVGNRTEWREIVPVDEKDLPKEDNPGGDK